MKRGWGGGTMAVERAVGRGASSAAPDTGYPRG